MHRSILPLFVVQADVDLYTRMKPACNFPKLPHKYDRALREAVSFVLERFKPIGIIAAGTIVRGTPDAASDLDIWVIHLAPVRQRLHF
jgi:hypothetical protein